MTTDPVAMLKERLAKAEAKHARHKKAAEAAEIEVNDVQTALRVFADVMNPASAAKPPEHSSTLERQRNIAMLLGAGNENGKPPAEVFALYNVIYSEAINIDTFRTTIWRMKDRVYDLKDGRWIVEGDNGVYWRRAVALGNIEEIFGGPFEPSSEPDVNFFDEDEPLEEEDDSDVPF